MCVCYVYMIVGAAVLSSVVMNSTVPACISMKSGICSVLFKKCIIVSAPQVPLYGDFVVLILLKCLFKHIAFKQSLEVLLIII